MTDRTQWKSLEDVEAEANEKLDAVLKAYLHGGAGLGTTVEDNLMAFRNLWLQPRICGPAANMPLTSIQLFEQQLELPVLLAPTSPQRLFHSEAELAVARAAKHSHTIYIASTDSHFQFSEISEASGKTAWFQLYGYGNRAKVEELIDMAVQDGARAIVVTVDATYAARRNALVKNAFYLPDFVHFGNLRALGLESSEATYDGRLPRLSITWSDLEWIRQKVSLPLLVKGVLAPTDALRCVSLGMDGIIVSNHGGRQLDSEVPSLVALEGIAKAVSGRCVILLDGGIRSGLDCIKALALGAKAVCIGRPHLWGLALLGEVGVAAVIGILRQELEDGLKQLGLTAVMDVGPSCIARK